MRIFPKAISILSALVISMSATSVLAADIVTSDSADSQTAIVMDNEAVLTKGVDYTIEYKDNVNVGEATVIIHFIGNYSGEKEQTFNIKRNPSSGGGGGSSRPSQNMSVTVNDKDGKTVNVTKKEDKDKVIITLPSKKELKEDEPYTITVTNKKGNPVETEVVLKDKKGNEATGKTDKNGKLTLPKSSAPTPVPTIEPEHSAYIAGYENGQFQPDGNITRAETAAILARLTDGFDENERNTSAFSDVDGALWYSKYISFEEKQDIIKGYEDGTFKPENNITRAEFASMITRFVKLRAADTELPFTDTNKHWAREQIAACYAAGYINGYEDGAFKPDSPITRAEAVKIINAVLGRDDFTNDKNPFSDVSNTHWAYKQILEAAVTH